MYYFFLALALSIACTSLVRRAAWLLRIVDRPDGERKLHNRSVPLLGGVAVFVAFWLVVGYLLLHPILGVELLSKKLWAAFIGSAMLLIIGVIDDIRPYSAKARLLLTALAVLATVFVGGGLVKINNPFGPDAFELGAGGGGVVAFIWLLGITYTTKILDGLDGLATGITAIGSIIIFLFTETPKYYQPNVGLVALLLAGVCVGFLIFNFYPASIFLGESGSLLLGFILGILAILSGGKLAIAALVMAIPILDLARVMFVRILRHRSLAQGDREHLHFRLVDRGLSQRSAVFILWAASALLGVVTLSLQSRGKVILLVVVFIVMVLIQMRLSNIIPSTRSSNPKL